MQTGSTQLEPNYLISVYADNKHLINFPFTVRETARKQFQKLKSIIQLNENFKKGDMVLWGKWKDDDYPIRMIETHCLRKEEV